MTELTEQRLGFGFGVLGGVLIALGALVALVVGTVDLVVGRPFGALGAATEAVLLFVVGGLAMFFAYLAHRDWSAHPLTSGVMLLVTALIAWIVIGIGGNLLALVGSLFVLMAGILYLVEPTKRAASAIVSA